MERFRGLAVLDDAADFAVPAISSYPNGDAVPSPRRKVLRLGSSSVWSAVVHDCRSRVRCTAAAEHFRTSDGSHAASYAARILRGTGATLRGRNLEPLCRQVGSAIRIVP